MVLPWFPISSSWNTARYIRGLIHGIGRGVPNGMSLVPKFLNELFHKNIMSIRMLIIKLEFHIVRILFFIPKGTAEQRAAREAAKAERLTTNEEDGNTSLYDKILDFPKAIIHLVYMIV